MASAPLLFSAVSSSTRQILLLLRCISFAKKTQVRISSDGLRFSTDEGSTMEASVFLDQSLFTSYSFKPPTPSSQDDETEAPVFEINLESLLETLNIFSLSDPNALKRPGGDHDAFAAHRLSRHAGINAFSNPTLGVTGVCTFSHDGEGTPLSIHMSEATGVTTTCDLTTYTADDSATEDIPFDRDRLALKAIMRSALLLDTVAELSTMSPTEMTITATPSTPSSTAAATSSSSSSTIPSGAATAASLNFSATGTLGSATVDFSTKTTSDTPVLETFYCPAPGAHATFKFSLVKAAQRAMASATKVSVRLDEEGVLSLQFLIEVDVASGGGGGDGIAFVDFRIVPLLEGEGDEEREGDGEGSGSDG